MERFVYRGFFVETYVLGDIHGCRNALDDVFSSAPIQVGDTIIPAGDLVNRGRHSKEVIDLMIEMRQRGYNIEALLGNHEVMFFALVGDSRILSAYAPGLIGLDSNDVIGLAPMVIGGFGPVIRSYTSGNADLEDVVIPDSHIEFFRGLKVFHYCETRPDESIFVAHGGLEPEAVSERSAQLDYQVALARTSLRRLIWVRPPARGLPYGYSDSMAYTVVYGHTPTLDGQPLIRSREIALDTSFWRRGQVPELADTVVFGEDDEEKGTVTLMRMSDRRYWQAQSSSDF
jgi:serine/threonine protein phosphatase 1